MARSVHIEYAYKVNMGKDTYESLEIRYGITEDAREGEKMNDLFKRVDDYVSKKLFDEVAAVKEKVNGH